jgi:NAD+ kinase
MRTLAQHLLGKGHSVRVIADEALALEGAGVHTVPESDLAVGADLIVAVGGDGTMLHAARMAAMADVPVLGINRGRLGFLADVGPEQMVQSLDDALGGRCQAERRMLLAAQVLADGRPIEALALNDVVVAKRETGRMVDVRTWAPCSASTVAGLGSSPTWDRSRCCRAWTMRSAAAAGPSGACCWRRTFSPTANPSTRSP